jgi:dGTPase
MYARPAPARYAVSPATARGRLHHEPEAATRSPWQRDRDRIIHSSAFRKLQYKTQVFVNHEGDFYRTRLTHSIEVAQVARSIARALGLDEDLTEALALAHDLGHPPFGHAGEDALNTVMKPFGGFDHNAQSLRIVTLLESRYAGWDGLNLTWETLEGLVKHNGPLRHPASYIADYNDRHKLDLHTQPSAEAQVAAIADDVAYHSHDLDDGLRARLFAVDDLQHLPLVGAALAAARVSSLDVPPARLRHETHRRVIDAMVTDLITETGARLAKLDPASADAIRRHKHRVVGFSPAMADGDQRFPVCQDVPPLEGQPHVGQGQASDRGSVSPAPHRPDAAARRLAREGGRRRHTAGRRYCRRLCGGNDRPLRNGRTPAADRYQRKWLSRLSRPGRTDRWSRRRKSAQDLSVRKPPAVCLAPIRERGPPKPLSASADRRSP